MVTTTDKVLVVTNLYKQFGALKALDDISFDVTQGEILGIAGPNGSGKSTLFNAITRIPFSPDSGTVQVQGKHISHMPNDKIARHGIVRTFQRESVFADLSAIDNVLVTVEQTSRAPRFKQRVALAEEALDLVGFPATLHNWKAGQLPVYLRKLVMIAGAVALAPVILLLDEPASGLTVQEIEKLRNLILSLHDSGITILLVEHVLNLLMAVSDRMMVLDAGKIIALGNPAEVIKDPTVIEAYLGAAA